MIDSDSLPIRDRILQALEEMPENRLRRGKYPKALGVHNTTIKRLVDKTSMPNAKNLAAICLATNKSADYFLFGSPPSLAEAAADLYDARPLPPLHEDLLIFTLATVEEYLLRTKTKILTLQKARLICKLYAHCLETKERPTTHLVEIYLRISL